ncbi:hypothetical protein AVEN_39862-1 [Araneus ventricosus]|uniref:Uncharacterized protein n=1 Tax=Araneus ventricosus TaxID=182803 RepID=A0A4Y2GMN5_ARAVE|nr:hypothetical protein AVEN_269448-1 [Araneus ventricosus]GBM54803.1 hypothetical protein AVEN_39862-1 [Araneus ventricosus]
MFRIKPFFHPVFEPLKPIDSSSLKSTSLPSRYLRMHLAISLPVPLAGVTRPTSFSGKISKHLTNCEKLPIVNFEAIELDEININKTDLSKDQLYLLDSVRAIQTGQCAPDLAVKAILNLSVTYDG